MAGNCSKIFFSIILNRHFIGNAIHLSFITFPDNRLINIFLNHCTH